MTPGIFDDLAASRDEAYAVVGARGVVTSWSPGAERLLGYTADDVLGLRGTGLLQDEADASRLVERCRAGEPLLGQTVLRHRDGSRVEVALHAQRLMSAGGELQWLIRANSADVVRQQNLGRALLRGLFTESPFHIDVFDARLCYVAQNARRVKGFAYRDFVGRAMREVAPAGVFDIDDFEARQRKVVATGEALVANEVHARDPEDPDRYRAFSETIVRLRGDSGEVIGLAHVVFEITDRVRARERLVLVNDASSRIGSTLEVLHTAQELTDVAIPVFADHAYVDLLDPVFGGEAPVAGPVDESVLLRRVANSSVREGQAGEAVATGDIDPFTSGVSSVFTRALASNESLLLTGSEVIAELAATDSRRAAPAEECGVHSWLLVPMFARGAALGVVVFERFRGEHAFEAGDVLLAEDVVARAAVCIDNARRYTRERTTALALQRSLLPQRMPALSAVEAASRYLPASCRTVLGGAWFDVISLSGARVALVVGDVPGNDLHSAVTMGRLRTAVRTLADLDLSPEELLTHLDDQVNRFQDEHAEGMAGRAVGTTCVYAVFAPLTRRCAVARVGHPAPARVRADGQFEFLDLPDGLPLGRGGAPFEKGEATLDDGDLLVLYTDGSPTVQGQGPETSLVSLRRALSGAGLTAAQRLDDICDTITGHLPAARRHEDVALLVGRVHGP